MKYLCDTHVLIWWLNGDQRLNKPIKSILADGNNIIYVSVASAWEISLKLKTNPQFRLKVPIEECFQKSGFEVLEITLSHVVQLHKLPLHHHDPFDRMLIAQAQAENASLITVDGKIGKYKVGLVKA